MPNPPADSRRIPTSVDDLPPPDTIRWHVHRKAQVVAGVRAGLISVEEACRRYRLSIEEFGSWQHLIDEFGLLGLRVTYSKQYRGSPCGGANSPGTGPFREAAKSRA